MLRCTCTNLIDVLAGILDCEDKVEDNPDDEILTELRQKQQELKAVSNYVVSVTKTLLDKAREEMKKQELKKKLATADAEVKSTPTKFEILQEKIKLFLKYW